MNPVQHTVISLAAGGPDAIPMGLAPDICNLLFVFEAERIPESDWRVRLSRISHSPLVVVALMIVAPKRAWPYALHWMCDSLTHEPYQWMWPFIRRNEQCD